MADPRLRNDGSDNWEVVGGMMPEVDNNKDLGKTAKQWKDIYFKGSLKDAANSLTLAQIIDHSTRHENGGADEISVAGLSGLLADSQTPLAHAASHLGGADDILATLDARYLLESDNLSDLDNIATARTNLGLIAGGAGDIWVEKAGDTMSGDLTIYDPVNDGNPQFRIGSDDNNEAHIQAVYDSGLQTLDYLLISTDSAGEGDIALMPASNFMGVGTTTPSHIVEASTAQGNGTIPFAGVAAIDTTRARKMVFGNFSTAAWSIGGLWYLGTATAPSASNHLFTSDLSSTYFNAPSAKLYFSIANSYFMNVSTNGVAINNGSTPNGAGVGFVLGSGKAGFGIVAPLAQVHIDQSVSDAAIPVLSLDQADLSEGFINFIGTSAASAVGPISSWTAGNSIQGFVRAEINGVQRWVAYYDDPTS